MAGKILIGTSDGLHELDGDQGTGLGGHEVGWLARDESGWWAVVDHHEVWSSHRAGEWRPAASLSGLRANCVLSTAEGPLVGTSEAHVYSLRGDALEPVRSFDETSERETWYTPWGGPPDVRSMSADPSGAVYANVHVGGVVRSADGGETWEPTVDIHSDVHQVLFDSGSGLVLAASARGLGISDDDGRSWRFDTGGLHANYLRAVTVAGGIVLVSASTGPSTDRAAVYRRRVGDTGPFDRCTEGLPEWFSENVDTACLAASGSRVALGTSDGSVYTSDDAGASWTLAAGGLRPVRCVALG